MTGSPVANQANDTCGRTAAGSQCAQCGRWPSERCSIDDEAEREAYYAALTGPHRSRPNATITAARALELKAEAKQLKMQQRITQSAALARVARREGFTSWPALMAAAGGREEVDEAKWDNPTIAQVGRAERHQERARRFGDGS